MVTDFETELTSLFGTYWVADFVSHMVDVQAVHLPMPSALDLGDRTTWVFRRFEPGSWGDLAPS